MREISQVPRFRVSTPQQGFLGIFLLLFVFSNFAFSAPKKVADRAGRGLSAPLWSPDGRFIAYTTLDRDELFVVELNEIKAKQSLYRVADLEGCGRRFVFAPGEERIVYRSIAAAMKGSPDRIVSTSYYQHDNTMLSDNTGQILGPYLIENQLFIRKSLNDPLVSLNHQEWSKGVFLDDGELTVKNSAGKVVYETAENEEAQGFEISPDGETVAAVVEVGGDKTVRVIQISSGLMTDLGKGRWPGWSGTGDRLVFVRDKHEVKFAELVVFDLTVGQSRSVLGLNQFWPNEPALNYDGTLVAFVHGGEVFTAEVTGF